MSTCWPARQEKGSVGARKKLVMVGVRGSRAMIVAACQRTAGRVEAARSVIGIPLLAPGVAVDVVTAQLPEPGLVARGELQAHDPFGRLPKVQMWHEQAGGAAVIGLDRPPVVVQRNQGLALCEIDQGHVG